VSDGAQVSAGKWPALICTGAGYRNFIHSGHLVSGLNQKQRNAPCTLLAAGRCRALSDQSYVTLEYVPRYVPMHVCT
jgi:hypothetical protein